MKNYKAEINNLIDNEPNFNGQTTDKILSLIREIVQEAVGEKFELKDNMTSDFRSFLDGRNYQSNIILSNVEKLLK